MQLNKIPQSLKNLKQWINWELQKQEKGPDKKMPVQVDGTPAKSNDPTTWTDFNTAVDAEPNFTGIGFVFSADDPYCGIDFDGCRDPKTGDVAEWAKGWIKRFDSYAEVSPSMTGVKIWIEGKLPFDTGKKVPVKAPPMGGKESAVEAYDHARYFAVTGLKLAGMPQEIQARQAILDAFCKEFFTETEAKRVDRESSRLSVIERARRYLDRVPGAVSGSGGHNQTFKVACLLVLGFSLTPTEALILMSEWNQRCEPKWTEKDLRHKVESADKQPGERGYLRDTKEENWGTAQIPDYKEPERPAAPEAEQSGPQWTNLQAATEKYLVRLKSGKPMLYPTGLSDLDKALGGGLAPGEVVMIAARPGHGKSALGLQFLDHLASIGVVSGIISEEMSADALAERTVQFSTGIAKEEWESRLSEVSTALADHFLGKTICHIVENCNTAKVAAECIKKLANEKEAKVVAVDYAQLLSSPGKGRYEQISNTSITLKRVAKEEKVTLLVMCQLSREIENRDQFIPRQSDLKDSGQLEQDADVIMSLVWPYNIDQTYPKNSYQIWLGKNKMRGIPIPVVNCDFNPERQRIAMVDYISSDATIYSGNRFRKTKKKFGGYNPGDRE